MLFCDQFKSGDILILLAQQDRKTHKILTYPQSHLWGVGEWETFSTDWGLKASLAGLTGLPDISCLGGVRLAGEVERGRGEREVLERL